MKFNNKGFTLVEVLFAGIFLLAIVGYIKNVTHLLHCDFKAPYKAEVIYGVGTCVPALGAVIGWIPIDDK